MERRSQHITINHAVTPWLLLLLVGGAGCSSDVEKTAEPWSAGQTLHPDQIVTPDGIGTLATGKHDALGRPLSVSCSTCHDTSTGSAPMRTDASQLNTVHKGLNFDHGKLRCGSCHDAEDRDKLRLADGRTLPFSQVMTLCGQCHGSQLRDYKHGAHGGMQGYWDRARGPRTRNNCVVCHDAHAPAIPQVMPAPGPRDRFLSSEHDETSKGKQEHE